MEFKFDQDYHIHSGLSSCSNDPKQTPERILEYAKQNGLSTVCITDHYWDSAVPGASDWYKPQDFEHISQSKPLPQCEGIKFLFGCETDMDKYLNLVLPISRFADFDFVIISTTHLHMTGFTITEQDAASNKRIAELWIERLDALLNMPLPFGKVGIAHLNCVLMNMRSHEDYLETMSLIPDSEMRRLFTKAAALGCGIELNKCDLKVAPEDEELLYRTFRIAKACGCRFYFGSDAHHPNQFDNCDEILKAAVLRLGLCEEDKFHIARAK